MPAVLEDIRARLDRGLNRAPAAMPTLEGLKARIDRGMGRSTSSPRARPAAATSEVPTLENLRARIQAAKGQPPIPRRRPGAPGALALDQTPYTPEPPQEPYEHEPAAPRSPRGRRPRATVPGEVDESQSLTRSALHGVVQGAAGGVAGLPESVAIGEQSARRYLLGQFDRIDAGQRPEITSAGVAMSQVVRYLNATPEDRQRYRGELEGTVRPVEETGLYRAGQSIRESAAEAFPIPAEHEGRFVVQLGRGVGTTGTFLLTGIAGRVLRLPALAVAAGTGAMVNSAQTFRDAVNNGASFETAAEAAKLSALVGTSEALPIARFLDTYDKASGGQLRTILVNAAKGGIEEGAQELFQSVADNLIAAGLYDPEREVFTGTGDAASVGFTVGALFNVLAGMLGVRVRSGRPQDAAPESTGEQAAPGLAPEPGAQDAPVRPPESPEAPLPPAAPPAAPDEPVVVKPGEDIGGKPIPPGPEAPPATLPDDIPRTVFRGSGRTEQGEAYSGPAVPILGPGRYYAFSRAAAEKFGPNVEEAAFAPKNPLIIRSDAEWRALTKEAGWQFPNPFGQSAEVVARQTEALQGVLRQRGHDAVVVYWDDTTETDIDRSGNEVKTLRTVFGQPQVFQLDEARTATAVPTPSVPAVFTSEAEGRPDLPLAAGAPKRVKIPPEAGLGVPETTEVKGPDGSVRVEVIRKPSQPGHPLGEIKFRSVRRSTESYLNEADRRRNAPTLAKDQKALAEEARASNLAAFDAAYQELAQRSATANVDALVAAEIERVRPKNIPGSMNTAFGMAFEEGVAGRGRTTYQDPIKATTYRKGYDLGETFRRSSKYREAVSQGGVVIETITARDKRTTFEFPPTEEGLEELLETKSRYEKLPVQTTGYGLIVPEAASPKTEIERTIDTEHGTARIVFPDELHERLFDLAEGRPDKAEARALYDEFKGYVLERFKGPPAVIALAREYRAEVLDQAESAARYRGGQTETASLVIDPDEQTRYLQRPTLANIRARVDRAMGREPQAEGELPETAYAGAGAAYQGFVRDKVEGITPAIPTKPLRREDILRPLLKALNVPLYQGRIKSKKFLGFYRRHIEEVRIKRMSDIEVAAHELAHLLDDRFPEIRQQWLPASKANAEVREELRGVSYDKSKLFEGFAEFVRLWSTQREEAKARAPKFYGWFEDFVARNEYGPALRKAQEGMHAWFAQDAVSRARSKIGVTKEINAGLTPLWDRFRQAVADDLHGIYRMERELTGGINPVGPYETARLTRAKHSMIEGTLLYGAPVVKPDGSHAFEGKGLSQILDPVADRLDDFLMYAVGRSAQELRSQGRERLFTGPEIKGMVELETPEFRKAFDEYQVWNRAILDFAEKKGVINPFFRATWKRAQYLPFHRVGQPGAFSPVPGDWKGIKALTGGTDNLRDILGNMIGNASMLIDAALTNEARLEVANLARQRGGAHFMARIPKDEKIVKVHRLEIERAILDALGVEQKTQLPIEKQIFIDQIVNSMGAMVPLIQRGQTPFGQNVVAVLNEGKPEYYEVADPLLYSALTHLNRPARHWVIRVLGVPKRIGQASITLAFDFLAANIQRDTLMGWVMSQHGFKPIVDSARGMKSRIASDPNYRDFIANGGGFSSYLRDETAFRTHLEKFYSKKGIDYRTVLDAPSKLLFAVERIADSFEMATRLGEYRKAIQAGEQPRHAAYSAREVSTDFAMRGDSAALGFMYDIVIFLKPAVNGMDRLYRGLAHDPNRVQIAVRSGLIAAASMGLLALNRGNPLYDDLEEWDKNVHWHFYPPKPETIQAWADGRPLPPLKDRYWHFRLMKIWEIGGMASLAERSLERFLDGQPEKIGEDAWRILRDVFRFEYLPAAVAPPYEVAINRIRFIDRPIETQAMKELQPWARSRPGGSRTLRALGEATRKLPTKFQASPAQVEALLRGYFHTWAQYGLMLSDAAFFDGTPSLRIDQYPVLRRFYQQTPPRHTKYVTQLYDALAEATAARRTMRHMDRTFRPDFAKEIEDTPENLEYGQLTSAQKGMRGISAEMRFTVDAPDLPTLQQHATDLGRERDLKARITRMRRSKAWGDLGDLKRELLDLWTEERNTLAKQVMQDIEAQRKQRREAASARPREEPGIITIRPGGVAADRQ